MFIANIDLCTNPRFLKILELVFTVTKWVCIVVPIVLMISLMITFIKNIVSEKEDIIDSLKKSIGKIVACFIVFLIPTFVSLLMSIINATNTSSRINECLNNIDNIEYYKELETIEKEQDKAKRDRLIAEQLENQAIERAAASNQNTNPEGSTSDDSNTGVISGVAGQKYNLTDSQLYGLAYICQREQGTAVGAAAEASLIANRFELFGSKYGTGGSGLYNYVANSGWWGSAGSKMSNASGVRNDVLASVKDVLVFGNRTLPMYVDEHDCIDCGSYGYDVIKIITGSTIIEAPGQAIKNHSNYVRNTTIIHNKYGSVYTFYTFPTSSSDPFGYTNSAMNKYNAMGGR